LVALYVVSAEEAAGKTAICAGIGRYLLGAGRKVGFLKPTTGGADGDVAFMKQVMALPEAVESLCPPVAKIKEAYAQASQGRDVVIVEGMIGQNAEDSLSKAAYEVAGALSARVVVVEDYSGQSSRFIDSYKGFGENLLGIVLNKVPKSRLERVRDEASAQFGGAGINLLGVLPEDRALYALTIGELANHIQGSILNEAEKSAELVENFMLGAMVVGSGLEYFGRKTNKTTVLRSDRPDMQLAALETPTRCLVLSGSTPPLYSVLNKAENKGIPVISTESDTDAIITSIEDALGKARFNQEKKLPKLAEIMQQLDLQALNKGLGLAG